MNISKLESGLKEKEDSSILESSLYNHREVFKKHPNRIKEVERNIEDISQTNHKLTIKNYSSKKTEVVDKKAAVLEKLSLNNDLHQLLNTQKKLENVDKTTKMKGIPLKNKFYLNNSFKSFQFNHALKKSITNDSSTKRNPSFSNSNLPTDIPSLKVKLTIYL